MLPMQNPKETSLPDQKPAAPAPAQKPEGEIGGSGKPEPTRYGDWEIKGIVSDF